MAKYLIIYKMDNESSDSLDDLIVINDLVAYLERCLVENRTIQAKNTIDRIIRLFQILKFNLDDE
jgi:hypothetical protein